MVKCHNLLFFFSCCGKILKKSYILNFIIDAKFNIQNKIFVISVLGLGGVVFDCLGGNTPPPPERNTAWNKGRKCFHCLGAPNNLIRPWIYPAYAAVYIGFKYFCLSFSLHFEMVQTLRKVRNRPAASRYSSVPQQCFSCNRPNRNI